MLSKKSKRASLYIVLGAFLLIGFQNCAPAEPGVMADVDGEVRIVDRWAQSKVEFMAESYLVDPNVDTVNIRGLCDQSADAIQWEASRPSDQGDVILGEGEVGCENGSFSVQVAVSDQELGGCNDSLELRASFSNDEAMTRLRLACF